MFYLGLVMNVLFWKFTSVFGKILRSYEFSNFLEIILVKYSLKTSAWQLPKNYVNRNFSSFIRGNVETSTRTLKEWWVLMCDMCTELFKMLSKFNTTSSLWSFGLVYMMLVKMWTSSGAMTKTNISGLLPLHSVPSQILSRVQWR